MITELSFKCAMVRLKELTKNLYLFTGVPLNAKKLEFIDQAPDGLFEIHAAVFLAYATLEIVRKSYKAISVWFENKQGE